MYWWVSAALRSHILGRFEIEEAELDDALEETVSTLASGPVADDAASGKSLALAERIAERENVTPALLLQTLRQGEVALFEALFAKVTGVRLTLLRRLLFEPGGEGLAIACKALDFDPADFATLFILTRKARPMDRVLLRGEVTRLVAFFQSMKKRSAELVVKRWQRDHGYLHAVWQVATNDENNVAAS
jgi:uncharacterized protein (DUF2336 family)